MKAKGDAYEDLACHHLQQAGLTLVTRHFRLGHWEVDLIMKEGATLVFVEVKYRKHQSYGGASQALSQGQIQRLRKAAQAYLQQNKLKEQKTQCRFDLVAITGLPPKQSIDWLKNAF